MSTRQPWPSRAHTTESISVKVVIAGGFGAGKTTLVRSLSEIEPLTTEEILTSEGEQIDSLDGVHGKTTTTVALDYGFRTLAVPEPMTLFLFGTPGQARFRFLWDELTRGAVGAVVLADTRRLPDSFESIDYFEERHVPFLVAVNAFDGAHPYPPEDVRHALELGPGVPVLTCDARDFGSAVDVLAALVSHALQTHTSTQAHVSTPSRPSTDRLGARP